VLPQVTILYLLGAIPDEMIDYVRQAAAYSLARLAGYLRSPREPLSVVDMVDLVVLLFISCILVSASQLAYGLFARIRRGLQHRSDRLLQHKTTLLVMLPPIRQFSLTCCSR
jgi:hypothetical protein